MSQRINSKGMRKLVLGALVAVLLALVIPTQALAKGRSWRTYSVKVDSGYLALRTHPSYDSRNEIGQLYTGDVVSVLDASSDPDSWVGYSYQYSRRGWVNQHYLRYLDNTPKGNYRVKVDKGYLALRTRPKYDDSNEIGKLYTGDWVILLDRYNSKYWWVYSEKYGSIGYVNCNYLNSMSPTEDYHGQYTVRVQKGYLALRTRPAYDDSNEIGQLYTGDVVIVKDKSQGQYWWVYSPKHQRDGYVNKDYLY